MSKKEKSAPMEEPVSQEQTAGAAEAEAAEETAPETFTLTREQMEQMEALAGQLAALNDKHLRLAAEYDNLERAVQQAGDEDNVHKKGMEMIFHQLTAVLEKLGATIVDPMGQSFDPERHEAVMHIESEELGESVVSQVFQKGFLLGEKVVRFAKVQVAN